MTVTVDHGGLYTADLSPRFGTEPGKTRPILVIQTDLLNEAGHPSTWILPCTTKLAGESLLRVVLPKGIAGNSSDCEILIDQSGAIDNRRIRRKLGTIPRPVLSEVKQKLRLLAEI